jgi:hypothetical protein
MMSACLPASLPACLPACFFPVCLCVNALINPLAFIVFEVKFVET